MQQVKGEGIPNAEKLKLMIMPQSVFYLRRGEQLTAWLREAEVE